MNVAEIEAQAYNVNVGQGKTILTLLAEIDKRLESEVGPAEAAVILDLARAMSNIGGKPA